MKLDSTNRLSRPGWAAMEHSKFYAEVDIRKQEVHPMMFKAAVRSKSLIAAAMLTLLVGCGSAEDRAKEYYESGMEFLEQKDFPRAAIEFRNALKLQEDYADAWYGMAMVEQQSQAWQRVYGDLTKVLEINPKHLKALLAISTLQSLGGDLQAALKNANTAMEVAPDDPNVIAHKATVLFKLDDQEGALREARRALALKPNHPGATMVVASGQLRSGDIDGALASADAALAESPKDLGLHLLKLAVLEKGGDVAKQEAGIREMMAMFPDRPEFRAGLIEFLISKNRSEEAVTELRAIMAAQPDDSDAGMDLVRLIFRTKGQDAAREELVKLASSHNKPFKFQMALADVEFAAGRTKEAEDLLRSVSKSLGISDDGIAAMLKLSGQLIARKQLPDAKTVIADVLKNDGENAVALSQRGQIQIEEGNYEAAIADLRAAINKDSKDFKSHSLLAVAYERNGQMELATKSLDDATKLSNYDPQIALGYAAFLVRRGREDNAEDLLQEVVRRTPGNRDASVMLAELYQRRGNWQGAEEIAQKLREENKDSSDADKILGRSLMGQKRFGEAVELLSKSTDQTPNDGESMRALVQAYVAAGKLDEAESFLTQVLQANPDNVNAIVMQGMLHLRKEKLEDAKKSFETAIARVPTAFAGYLALADYHSRMKNVDESIKVLQQGISAAKDKNSLRFTLAGRYGSKGQFDEAIKVYEEIVAEAPGSLMAVNNLASLLSDHRTDQASLDRAVSYAGMLRNSPVPSFRETLGWALVRSGRLKEGLNLLERTIAELDKNASAHFHLGSAYAQAGDKTLASKHLKLALELETLPESKDKIEAALKELDKTVQQ